MSKQPTQKPRKATPKKSAKAKKGAVSKAEKKQAQPETPKKPIWKRLFYYSAIIGVWGFILGFLVLAYLSLDLPDLENPHTPGSNDTAVVVKAANGATLVRSGPIHGDRIPYNEIPDALVRAFTSVEDREFFSHSGVNAKGLIRALWTNIRAGGVRAGGSTITQQLAKNLFLSNERTIKRKAQELLLTLWIEQRFTKEQILTLYLNNVYFGGGAYGIDAASRKFYGHSARELSISEAALLAGLVKAPSRYAPHINPEGAWKRARVVLKTMVEEGVITQQVADKLKTQPPRIKEASAGRDVRFFTDWVEQAAHNMLPETAGKSLIIYTTLDPSVQRAAAMALERGLEGEGKERSASQGAVVAIDHDGAVRAMVGGSDYAKTQYNRATQALRQPGSAFKLFSYLAALEAGIKPTDRYIDEKTSIGDWSPKNYNGKFNGPMDMQEAFARSINTVAVQISEEVGRNRVASMAKRLGISTEVEALASLPLGTEEVKLIDLASSYAVIANGGHLAPAYAIVEITSLDGEVLYRKPPVRPVPALAYPVVKDMTEMLTSVVTWGSGKNARIDRPAAGKSGTSQDSRDAVFVGFTSDMTTAVWVGNDNGTPMKAVTGGGLPARIWSDFMLEAHVGQPIRPLLADAGIYSTSAGPEKIIEEKPKKKKKKGFLERIFGGKD
ncbi:PBP1A family penicillin-binding protein [Kordiimonas sp. SCSIO 12603]|uniref:transglycosylase domain-containing protein n=1 Tax=Kordiimonas sp. SCSIO 12603 TaxID=2829596 RepID=UPI0021058CA4|nr:PBP1A family penicillin-binding protein [Kordiimonas sp. SCSIO 12603]UTW58651.1 PBP1A family penicillin-binding protein [Kordiimonas sp. SCSIO 12603]